MMRSLRFLAAPVQGLHSAVYVLAMFAVLSSLLALLRDRLFAHYFGAGTELDLYYAAFRIPDLLFVAIGSLVSVYILIPELSKRGLDQRKTYIDSIVVGFSILAVGVSALAAFIAPTILRLLFPQFAADGHLPMLVDLTRIMLLQPILLGLSNILAALTQTAQRYVLYSISPVLYNLGIIGGLVALYPQFGLLGLAWGVVIGAALHLSIQLPSLMSEGYFKTIPLMRDGAALIRTAIISIPRALTLSMNQISFSALLVLAGLLSSGSIAVFVLAFNLVSVPLSIIGASYSVAAFPTLAQALSQGRRNDFIEYVAVAARYILFWSVPATGLIIVLRAHIVRVILGSGAFDWTDTRLTAAAFATLSIALAAQGLTLLLARAYYAAGRTFVPFGIAVVTGTLTVGLGWGLINAFNDARILDLTQDVMRLEGLSGVSILALCIAYAISAIVGTIALSLHFEYRFGGLFQRVGSTLVHSIVAAIVSGGAAYLALLVLGPVTLFSTVLSIFMKGLAAGLVGMAGGALAYWMMRNKEFTETVASMRSRLWKQATLETPPLASAEEISPSSPQ